MLQVLQALKVPKVPDVSNATKRLQGDEKLNSTILAFGIFLGGRGKVY